LNASLYATQQAFKETRRWFVVRAERGSLAALHDEDVTTTCVSGYTNQNGRQFIFIEFLSGLTLGRKKVRLSKICTHVPIISKKFQGRLQQRAQWSD
jgi:hypothetical protein